MDKITIDTYNKMSEEYDKETADFWDRFPEEVFKYFIEHCKGKRILDLGSGPGRDALILKEIGFDVICLDASQKMVEICQSKGLQTVQADLMSIPFADKEFDGVWAYTSLLHISKNKIDKALIEIKRVLKDGGVFGLGMIEGEEELYRHSSGVSMPRFFAYYQEKELQDKLYEHGFKMIYFHAFKPRTKRYLNYICIKK
jgi:ubiquinone/menaquinone biosynthesis C-methylase UbiE